MSNTLKLGNGKWATGKDTLLSFSDTNNNYKPLAFSFSRASSGTVVNKAGLIETVGSGEPRIDFKDNTKGALLLEPQRTNYVLKSNDFSLLSGGFVTPNYGTSPEGLSVSRILFTDANQSMSSGTSLSTGVVCNFSAYVKGIKGQFIKFAAGGVDIAHTFSGEWERLSGSATSINNSWNLNTYGYATARDFLLCGVQLEQGSYATSYIPTNGSAVTRVEESTSQTVPDGVIGQTEGTIFVDVDFETLSGTNMFVSIRPDASNKIEIYRSDAIIYGEFASTNSFNFNKTNVTVGRYKIAVAYSSGSSAMYINGVLIGSNTTSFAFTSTLDDVYINSRGTSFIEQSNYKDLKLYNTRLSNSELAALTS